MYTGGEIKIIKDKSFYKTSDYSWINIEIDNMRIGKARIYGLIKSLRVYSITIFPEFERNGYAQIVIDLFKERYDVIIADRVRNTALGFWEKMGFVSDCSGNYIWRKGG